MRHAPAINDYITRDEVAALSAKSDARAAATVMFQAGLAVAAFGLAILWPNPLTILAAIGFRPSGSSPTTARTARSFARRS